MHNNFGIFMMTQYKCGIGKYVTALQDYKNMHKIGSSEVYLSYLWHKDVAVFG